MNIFFSFLIFIFVIFISPYFLISIINRKRKYFLNNSIIKGYSILFSFSLVWIIFFVGFFFNINLKLVFVLICIGVIIYIILNNKYFTNSINLVAMIITILYIYVNNHYIGTIFTEGDSVVSWNRWAIELSSNYYKPYNSAYPILYPALWSIIYKVQNTTDIWITAKITLFIFPLFIIFLTISLYRDTNKSFFIFILILTFIFTSNEHTFSGYMDLIVMQFGLVSLMFLYAYHNLENKHYLYLSIMFSGISAIVKQPGLIFIIFDIVYIIFNLKRILVDYRIYLTFLGSFTYFISFMLFFFYYQDNLIGNLSELQELSNKLVLNKDFYQICNELINKFFFSIISSKYIIILLVIFTVINYAKYRLFTKFEKLLFVFIIINFFIWTSSFSYDFRNSIYIFSFIITLLSILISKVIYINNDIFNRLLFKQSNLLFKILIISCLIVFLNMDLSDKKINELQIQQQKQIGFVDLASELSNILKHTSDCVQVKSNIQVTMFNYLLQPYMHRIDYGGYTPETFINEFLDSGCSDGLYWVVAFWYPDNKIAEQYKKLLAEKKIEQISGYIYKVNRR